MISYAAWPQVRLSWKSRSSGRALAEWSVERQPSLVKSRSLRGGSGHPTSARARTDQKVGGPAAGLESHLLNDISRSGRLMRTTTQRVSALGNQLSSQPIGQRPAMSVSKPVDNDIKGRLALITGASGGYLLLSIRVLSS